MAPDVVYLVRRGHRNEELRYSLRSLTVNVPHARVWIAGFCPSWVRNVERISVLQKRSKYLNSTANLRAACSLSGVSNEFLLFNDDFFVMRPIKAMPVLHRGPLPSVIDYYERYGGGPYVEGMRQTRRLLAALGHPNPMSYELHVPLPVNKAAMLDALARGRGIPVLHKRTLYGNLAGIGGTPSEDFKVRSRADVGFEAWPFISTMDWLFEAEEVGRFVRAAFPQPSPYEAPG